MNTCNIKTEAIERLSEEFGNEQVQTTVMEFLSAHPGDVFHLMTPGGYVDLSSEQAVELLRGNSVLGNPGCSGYDCEIAADEILTQIIRRCDRHDCMWYLISDFM